jgi:hypothetical protein
MNYYLIWTDSGWLKSPIYNQFIYRMQAGDAVMYDEVNTTYDIRRAYRFNDSQIKDALGFLQCMGVASWAIESKEDMLQNVLQELRQKRKEKNNG